MNRDELQSLLRQQRIDPGAYSLTGGSPNEQYVLSREANGRCAVYYSERGTRSGERSFGTEDEACRYLLRLLGGDPSS